MTFFSRKKNNATSTVETFETLVEIIRRLGKPSAGRKTFKNRKSTSMATFWPRFRPTSSPELQVMTHFQNLTAAF